MANPKHLEVVRKGTLALKKWRKENPTEILNLYKANLSRLDLSGANLFQSNFSYANLSETNLSKANMMCTTLLQANLSKANLSQGNLYEANLDSANLSKANLSQGNLYEANLSGANLSKANLSGASLLLANLHGANLAGANLKKAKLPYTDLVSANLHGANLIEAELDLSRLVSADLSGARLSGASLCDCDLSLANLSKADFSGADLSYATFLNLKVSGLNLSGANLHMARLHGLGTSKVNITKAVLESTTFTACNLANFKGLETVKNEGPSYIDISTLTETFRNSGNRITTELENFYINSGIPRELIHELPRILTEIKYFNCFICYGSPDLDFAKRLWKDLKSRGVTCWLYNMDATVGKRTWEEIGQKMREAEKMIVLCSVKSLIREGVKNEIEEQIDEDPGKIVPISLDNLWKQNGFSVKRGQRELKPFLLEKNYADFCYEGQYKDALKKLLRGISVDQ